jgi:hypothetical protein
MGASELGRGKSPNALRAKGVEKEEEEEEDSENSLTCTSSWRDIF